MQRLGLDSAEYIKCLVIDYLLSHYPDTIVGNECMYGIRRNLVDLVMMHKNRLTAIEIKSNHDNLTRLVNQVEQYKKVFNYVYVVSTEKYIEAIFNLLPHDVGLVLVSHDDVISVKRHALLQKHNDKSEILFSINAKYLRSLGNFPPSKYSSDEVRQSLQKKRLSYVQDVLYNYLLDKYRIRFQLFLSERGNYTHVDDINLLSTSYFLE